MRFSVSCRELSIHVPHVGPAIDVFNFQVLFRVNLHCVISCWVELETELPVVLNSDNELLAGTVIGRQENHGLVVNIPIVHARESQIRCRNRVPVNVLRHLRSLSVLPTRSRHQAVEIRLDGEVKIAVNSRHCDFVLSLESEVLLLVVPGISVSFSISVVSNLIASETGEEVG